MERGLAKILGKRGVLFECLWMKGAESLELRGEEKTAEEKRKKEKGGKVVLHISFPDLLLDESWYDKRNTKRKEMLRHI